MQAKWIKLDLLNLHIIDQDRWCYRNIELQRQQHVLSFGGINPLISLLHTSLLRYQRHAA